jgi:hypothetical protein
MAKAATKLSFPPNSSMEYKNRLSGERAMKNGLCTPVVRLSGFSVPVSESKPNA